MNLRVLKNKNFTLLLFGQFTSEIGGSIFEIALALYVLDLTGSAARFAFILAMGTIPKLLLYPFTGAFVDRYDRKKLIVILDLFRGVFLLAIYCMTSNTSLSMGYIYLITFIFGMCETLFSPAIHTVIPFVFKSDDYEDAYACNEMIMRVSWMISPLLGTTLYTLVGIKILLLIDGITFLASAFSEVFIKLKKVKESAIYSNVFNDIKEGIVELFKLKSVLLLTIASFLTSMFIIPVFRIILPYFFKETLNTPNYYIGIYRTIQISGGILGLFFVNSAKKKFGKISGIPPLTKARTILFMLFIILGLNPVLSFLKINPLYALIFVSIVLFKIIVLTSILNVFNTGLYQRQIPKKLLGRFYTTDFCLSSIGEIIGLNLFGLLIDHTPLIFPMATVVFGVLLSAYMVIKAVSLYKPIEQLNES